MKLISTEDHEKWCMGVVPRGITPGQFVPVAAAQVEFTTEDEVANPEILSGLYVAQRTVEETLNRTFPVERHLIGELSRNLFRVQRQITRIEHADIGLPVIDPSFLSWKTPEGYPGFSVYSLDEYRCEIVFSTQRVRDSRGTITTTPKLHQLIATHYLDDGLMGLFKAEAEQYGLRQISLTATYEGAMPTSVRNKIHEYLHPVHPRYRFERIYIIAEAPQWQRNTVAQIPVGDPLVVGIAHGLMWLIDKYDTSPVERFVLDLCTQGRSFEGN